MDTPDLHTLLAGLNIGAVQYTPTISSTNDAARAWLGEDAPDLALCVAGEQTAGRGQGGRTWQSPAGASLAFSLVLRKNLQSSPVPISRLTALGALAVCEALTHWNLHPAIKWPNDVLVNGRKVAGVLVEADWSGNDLQGVVLGIGVNVQSDAVHIAQVREGSLRYPATSVEEAAGQPVDRWTLLREILTSLLSWRTRLEEPAFLQAWEQALAFRGETIQLTVPSAAQLEVVTYQGVLGGLSPDGALRLKTPQGDTLIFHAGEVRLLPLSARA